MAGNQIKLIITSAIAIGGQIKTPGTEVTVDEDLAKNLMHRGRAELATDGGQAKADKPLAEQTVPQLKALAATFDIEGAANMNKADLVAAIDEAQSE